MIIKIKEGKKKMFKKIGKYIVQKISGNLMGRLARWGFWGLVITFPGPAVSAIGVSGLTVALITVHSGIVEYGTSSIISRSVG